MYDSQKQGHGHLDGRGKRNGTSTTTNPDSSIGSIGGPKHGISGVQSRFWEWICNNTDSLQDQDW